MNLWQEHSPKELMDLYYCPGNIPRLSIIVALGNLLLDSGGRHNEIESFLCSALTDKDGILALAWADIPTPKERHRLFKEFMESCYAFLSVCQENLDDDTIYVLNRLKGDPPYPGFMQAVKNKVHFSKMEKAVVLVREQSPAVQNLFRSEEDVYARI